MYYFNINGSVNTCEIYLVAFVYDGINNTNVNLIFKNNQWIAHFTNYHKLIFPEFNRFMSFGFEFMVNLNLNICALICVFLLVV